MKHQVKIGLLLATLSTSAYYVPLHFAGLPDYDLTIVPAEFYNYYCWATTGNLFLVAIYSLFLFIFIDSKHYKLKTIFCWLFIAETYTVLNYAFSKFHQLEIYDSLEFVFTFFLFTGCFLWFLSRALKNGKSDEFEINQSYLIKFKPKNIWGIFNHLLNLRGHAGIYQDGKLYKFKRRTGRLSLIKIKPEWIEKKIETGEILLEKISKVVYINSLIGQKYRLLKFNCNTLARHARKKN